MPRLKLHYEGWVALPEAFHRKLGLERGAEIEAELVDGTIVLRPAKGSARAGEEGSIPELSKAVPASLDHAAEAREPDQPAAVPEVLPAPKRRGRPPKAKAQQVDG
jgi:antitoxin component of MazEF toxin-antitoxin module